MLAFCGPGTLALTWFFLSAVCIEALALVIPLSPPHQSVSVDCPQSPHLGQVPLFCPVNSLPVFVESF